MGNGSLTLAGSTTISAGSLVINGDQSASTGAVTVSAGATLRGTGILGGPATVSGVIAPGIAATPGALTTRANLTLAPGSTLRLRVDAAAHDTLVIENPDSTGATSRTLALGDELRLEIGAATPLGETNLIARDALVALSGDFATAELVVGAEPAIPLQSISGAWVGASHDRDYAFDPVTGALTISSASTATALESWRLAHLQSADPVGDAANDADPDGDGLPNLLEYALGTLPREANASPLLLARTGDDRLTLTFPVRDDTSLIYTVEASDDLATWSPVFEANGATLAAAGPTHTATDPEPLSTHPRRFLRLVVGIAP